ncbi:tetratricopeptide repeat protein [Aphanothece sacrum]|uniref:Tetratricopeptide repeat domain protein n=1 Tax=Aphanothece sacrum FPU1 TaxID=1920663 RepID=A0A401IK92_APHSA|nr:tetratricopeptide repeat protein [Aphanothece sacrum]GBF81718.1 tetratricopeptide repeat domain protein [Aphanothece sacrum FPU1]GBF85076.1 tetratricopeptide repeat protein [Aphanothece sacrum FPU3]
MNHNLPKKSQYRGLILLRTYNFSPITYLLYLKIAILTTFFLESPLWGKTVNHLSLEIKPNFISQNYSSDPNLNDLLIEGMEKGIKGDYQGAIANFTQVITINRYEVEAYYNRGLAYGKINNYQAAIADFEKALSLDKELAEVYLERAKISIILGNKTQAIADFKTAAQLFKKQGNNYDYQETQKLLNSLN